MENSPSDPLSTAVDWDDLPKFSAWPARLLGAQFFAPRQRTSDEVLREYDREKWGTALSYLQSGGRPDEEALLRQQGIDPEESSLYMLEDRFLTAPAREVMKSYQDLLLETLRPLAPEILVELGCGMGDKLLKVARDLGSREVYGGEFTRSGVECGRLLATRLGVPARFEHFDYNEPDTQESVPTQATVFTSHSIEQIPQLRESFVEGLIQRKPKRVIHFEPCFEDQDPTTLLGLMRRRYTEMNDYNKNLVGLLRSFEHRNALRIVEHQANIFSDTPFNPTSILIWEPS